MRILNTFYLALNNQKIVYIKNDSQLLEVVEKISNIDEISIDTEFTWRNTYFPRLSLIQIGSAEILYIIDPLVIEKLNNLNSIFEDNEITKVFHSSRGDMAVLKNSIGSSFKNIYDTQIAQKLISNEIDQISYKNLVEFYFYKNLSKSQTNSDWEKRPLSEEQILYAAEDIKYLLTIKKIQLKKLENKKLIDNFEISCVNEISLAEQDFSDTRLNRLRKKYKNISKIECEIFLWRENRAKLKNVPPNKIFKDKYLRKIKDLIQNKKIKDLDWIILNDEDRKTFLRNF